MKWAFGSLLFRYDYWLQCSIAAGNSFSACMFVKYLHFLYFDSKEIFVSLRD